MPIDKNQYTLSELKTVEELLLIIKEMLFKYVDVIEEEPWPTELTVGKINLSIVPVAKDLQFYFRIFDIRIDETTERLYWSDYLTGKGLEIKYVAYKYSYVPISPIRLHSLKKGKDEIFFKEKKYLAKDLETWIETVKGYYDLKLSAKDQSFANRTQQVYNYFDIEDDTDNEKPFDRHQQLFLDQLLLTLSEAVNNPHNKVDNAQEISNDIDKLRDAIPDLSKKTVTKGVARIFAKIKTPVGKFLWDVLDVAKKEIIKEALRGGWHELQGGLHHLLPQLF